MAEPGSYVRGKNKNQILEDMYGTAQPGSVVHEQQKMAVMVRCTEDLEKVIKEASDSANNLSQRIVWLNRILAGATILGAFATFLLAYKSFFP